MGGMATLLGTPTAPLTIRDLAKISPQLADDLSGLVLRSEGFSVEDYLKLDGNYFVEFNEGCLQVLPMPTALHQSLILFLVMSLRGWMTRQEPGGRLLFSPFFVKLSASQYREPDVCLMRAANVSRCHAQHWDGADFVIEIVSDTNRDHDWITKRREYAVSGIPEYWIVDPTTREVVVLHLVSGTYVEAGRYTEGQLARSVTLGGFEVDVKGMFEEAMRNA
jgi:Uma2 family endonuclease